MENLTLCIPTFNRSHYLGRILRYYKEVEFRYPIIVADSSAEPHRSINKKFVAEVSDILQVDYREYDSVVTVCTKIVRAMNDCGSEFVCICADDDFILPKSIAQCAGFLLAHPDYSITHGHVLMSLFLPPTDGAGPEALYTYTYAQLGTKADDDLERRLMSYYKNNGSTFYSVYRRSNLINNLKVIDSNTKRPHFAELLLDSLNCIQGKVKCLDLLFGVRQFTPERESAKLLSWADFIRTDDFDVEYKLFTQFLTAELVRKGLSGARSKKIVDSGFRDFTRDVRKNRWQMMPSTLIRGGGHFLKLIFHPDLGDKLPRIRHFLANPRESRLKARCDNDIFSVKKLTDPKSVYREAFSVVYDYLIKYPRGIDAGI